MNRAYSILEVKEISEDDDERIITGIATTPTPDRAGDIVEPLGVKFNKQGMPLLWQHRSSEPIGTVKFEKPTKDGIRFEARLPKVKEAGRLKDRIDEAWQSVKLKLVRAVSIGFRAIEFAFMDDGGVHYTKTEVLELSLVTIPAHQDALIETVKSIDHPLLAASGIRVDGRPKPPGVTGPRNKDHKIMTLAEQIAAFEAKRQANAARMKALMDEVAKTGEVLSQEQEEEYDTLESEVTAIDKHLVRLRRQEQVLKAEATVISNIHTPEGAAAARENDPAARPVTRVKVLKTQLPQGLPFVRMVGALAAARGNRLEAAETAKLKWADSTPEVEAVLRVPVDIIEKAAVDAGTTSHSTWASPLVEYQNMASEFINFLRPLSIIGRINGFRRVPFNIKVPRMTAGASVNWVGETKVKPLSSLAFDSLTLDFFKIAGIIPLSEELIRFSSPSAELLVRDDLAGAVVQLMDRDFVDPSKALAAGVSPASITNGVTPRIASGTTAAAFRADVKAMLDPMIIAGVPLSTGVWIMKQGRALSLSLMMNALGQAEFPNINMSGGTLLGFPVITSENVPAQGGSPTDGDLIIFAIAGEIMLADDSGVNIDMSREASLQMETTPDSPVTASTVTVSLWQHNMVAIKAERFINWEKRRSTAVGYISSAKYG